MPVWLCSFKTGAKVLVIETEANDCYNTHRGWVKIKEVHLSKISALRALSKISEVQIAHPQLDCALCSIVVQQLAIPSTSTECYIWNMDWWIDTHAGRRGTGF